MSNTPRLGLTQIAGTDQVSAFPPVYDRSLNILDNAALVVSGALAARPAAGTFGRWYLATDDPTSGLAMGTLYFDNGSTWTNPESGLAMLAGATFSGTVTIPTAVIAALSGTPNFTGAATGQTATLGDNSKKLATTEFVKANAGGGGTGTIFAAPQISSNLNFIAAAGTLYVVEVGIASGAALTGVTFISGGGVGGTVTFYLFGPTGTLLASTAGAVPPSGWQRVPFTSPYTTTATANYFLGVKDTNSDSLGNGFQPASRGGPYVSYAGGNITPPTGLGALPSNAILGMATY